MGWTNNALAFVLLVCLFVVAVLDVLFVCFCCFAFVGCCSLNIVVVGGGGLSISPWHGIAMSRDVSTLHEAS